ncbi:MAG: GNAT family N-acetyltransferase [Microcoleaceae cyanobacterium]
MQYRNFLIRSWQPHDRTAVIQLITQVLSEYGFTCEPEGADIDVYRVEDCYFQVGGEFWVVEQGNRLVGTAAYYPSHRQPNSVELRKMYLLPEARGWGLGKFLLQMLEKTIWQRGFDQIWLETASSLQQAVKLYESQDYQPTIGVETQRCDRVYWKRRPS